MAKKEYKKPLVYVQKGNGKKTYQPPKATVYKAEKAPKANNGGGFRISARTTVMGAVSLLLMIGLIASVFFAYENSTRAEGEAFQYFSPARFLENLSEKELVIEGDTYEVWLEYEKKWYQLEGRYWGYLDIGGNRIKSITFVNEFLINKPDVNFTFYINGVHYISNAYALQGPGLEVEFTRRVELPDIVLEWNTMPDFDTVADAWKSIGDNGGVFNALGTTAYYISDMLKYQANIMQTILPWNSVVMSNEAPEDETAINLPWRVNGSSYVPLP